MCGILGVVSTGNRTASVSDRQVEVMRDRMAHRGPDGSGLWRGEGVVLAHRRLAVIDRSPAGHQPMVSASARSALVYNGELYNDEELRAELGRRGHTFRSTSDAETVLTLLDRAGEHAVDQLRGMYALAYVNLDTKTLLLARDPLGIKPLYYAVPTVGGSEELVFASEVPALLAHPAILPRPDPVAISAYLTTIRTTLGRRTLFAGIHTLEPGEVITVDLRRRDLVLRRRRWWQPARDTHAGAPPDADLRTAVEDSVRRHLRADVPTCCLLSGGLDSTIIATHASRLAHGTPVRTYCSGCPDGAGEPDDLTVARQVAGRLGSSHTEAPVTRGLFSRRWPEMIGAMGLPLGTPNEVAINAVARRLREDGQIVALSGEGADELFGGYETPLTQCLTHLDGLAKDDSETWRIRGGEFQLDSCAWVTRAAKGSILRQGTFRTAEGDQHLAEFYITRFEQVASQNDSPSRFETHLRFAQEINLTGLLLRLDQATMLEGVEGRTPFADRVIAGLAANIPQARKFIPGRGGPADEFPSLSRTKIALRAAFGADLPSIVLSRPKASFPLPFQDWLADQTAVLRESTFARSIFTDGAVEAIVHDPKKFWPIAWPVLNIALWGRHWWG